MKTSARCQFSPFTLIEVILAMVISAILLAGVVTAFRQSLTLREQSFRVAETQTRLRVAETALRTALQNVALPSDLLGGTFVGTKEENGDQRLDSLSLNVLSSALDSRCLGDILNLEFVLEEDEDTGKYRLLKNVTRNLLSLEEEEPEETELLNDIYGMEITYYNGTDWTDSWDSSTVDNALPEAVLVHISFQPEDSDETNPQAPLELLVPIVIGQAQEASK
jgi:prepilin-type N-terminal cleavage/methylation domain-containing protein